MLDVVLDGSNLVFKHAACHRLVLLAQIYDHCFGLPLCPINLIGDIVGQEDHFCISSHTNMER
jgi:hypothetical protein